MYRYLGYKHQKIQEKEFYNVSVLYCDDAHCNYSVLRFYLVANDENKSKLDYFPHLEDIEEYIAFKVRHDGKISLTLK